MRRLLIIDDDDVNRELFRWALEDRYELHELPNGIGAAEEICSGRYDLVFLDIMMPIVNGVEVIESVAEHDRDSLSSIIVVTAALNANTRQKLAGFPVADIVERPYQPEEISALVDRFAA